MAINFTTRKQVDQEALATSPQPLDTPVEALTDRPAPYYPADYWRCILRKERLNVQFFHLRHVEDCIKSYHARRKEEFRTLQNAGEVG